MRHCHLSYFLARLLLVMSTMTVFLWQACNASQWTVLLGYLYCLKNVSCYQTHCSRNYFILFFFYKKTAHHCIVHATQSNCCSKKLNLIGPALRPPNNQVLIRHWLQNFEINAAAWAYCESTRLEKTSSYWKKSWKAVWIKICCFCLLSGSAKTLIRWGGKINQLLIAQSLKMFYARNCESRITFAWVSPLLKLTWIFFWDTVYRHTCTYECHSRTLRVQGLMTSV